MLTRQILTNNVDNGEAQLNEERHSPRVVVGSSAHRNGYSGCQDLTDVVEGVEKPHCSSTVVR